MEISINEIQKLTSPNPFALITSGKGEESNIMALSWWTFVSNRPPMLAVCLSSKGYTHELIDDTGEFGVHLVGDEFREKALKCGQCSGKNIDKIKELEFSMRDADQIRTKLISGCIAALECRTVSKTEVADHFLYIAEIVRIHKESDAKQLLAWEGYRYLSTITKWQDSK